MTNSIETPRVTADHAFRAMYEFISAHFAAAPNGGVPTLLADIEMQPDGIPGDPGAWSEWLEALERSNPDVRHVDES